MTIYACYAKWFSGRESDVFSLASGAHFYGNPISYAFRKREDGAFEAWCDERYVVVNYGECLVRYCGNGEIYSMPFEQFDSVYGYPKDIHPNDWAAFCTPYKEPPIVTYFLQSMGGDYLIKIGKTRDVKKRIASLQTGSPYPLKLLGVADRDIEAITHRDFSACRSIGEWFYPSELLLSRANCYRVCRHRLKWFNGSDVVCRFCNEFISDIGSFISRSKYAT